MMVLAKVRIRQLILGSNLKRFGMELGIFAQKNGDIIRKVCSTNFFIVQQLVLTFF